MSSSCLLILGITNRYVSLDLLPPAVEITTTGLPIVGQSYSLQCSADVVAGLVVGPDLVLVAPNGSVVASQRSTTTLTHTFPRLRIHDGGQYTCTATTTIPEAGGITDLRNSVTETLSVACMSL